MFRILLLAIGFCSHTSFASLSQDKKAQDKKLKDKKLKVLILGDSITEGYGVDVGKAFPALLQTKFHNDGYKGVKVIGSGVAGDTSASGVGRLRWLLKSKPDVLLLELGGNDGLRGIKLAATKSNLRKTVALAKKNGLKVILMGVKLPPNYSQAFNQRFTKVFADVAKADKIPLIPFFFDKLEKASSEKLVLKDGLHPNEAGHRAIAQELYKLLPGML